MRNNYFQFKQFRVEQDRCAMKICTDSCVFGAYIDVTGAQRVLDIGAGTGLLSLMVAQRSAAIIDAVEIHPEAQVQARDNFAASSWAGRLHLHPMPLQQYAAQQPYEVILSNPPFFLASLKSGNAAKNAAKHTGDLLFEDILQFAQHHLTTEGSLYLLLPPAEAAHFQKTAQAYRFHLAETVEIFTYIGGKCIRHIQAYSFSPTNAPAMKQFYIREQDKVTYTQEFVALLQPYYLHL